MVLFLTNIDDRGAAGGAVFGGYFGKEEWAAFQIIRYDGNSEKGKTNQSYYEITLVFLWVVYHSEDQKINVVKILLTEKQNDGKPSKFTPTEETDETGEFQ